ncbi:MmgE/PrpD family protein [Nocardioides sp. R-C-SC26]|uniref:MmgE/PrpD family protein n=1 Tax=Nocardioides sp. R-C-SC26 TaxID=2870414 RepID=UPI001E4723EC|nr:MmgE/PrpD family protein [Nocardioides sp. R-C-SC26]
MTLRPSGWAAWRMGLAERLAEDPCGDVRIRRRVSAVLADDLAAAVGAIRHSEVRRFGASATRTSASGEASVLAGHRAGREQAAAANAVAMCWEELDGGYRPAPCHGGLYTIPAALAEGEAVDASLDDVLRAVAVGYEVAAGLARAFPTEPPLLVHPHAMLAPVGAAAAVAWLRDGSPSTVLAAADLAVTLGAVGPFSHAARGIAGRNVWAAAGARNGFLAADAVAAGIEADPASALDVLLDTLGHRAAIDGSSWRRPWAVAEAYHKVYAACQYTHSAIEAAHDLATGPLDGVSADELVEVEIAAHPLAIGLDLRHPETVLGGKFSLPHVVAVTLATGRTDPPVFGADLLGSPVVRSVRERIRVVPFPAAVHGERPATVRVLLRDGTSHESTCRSAVGSPDRPLTDAQLLDKIELLTAESCPAFPSVAAALVEGTLAGDTPIRDVMASTRSVVQV